MAMLASKQTLSAMGSGPAQLQPTRDYSNVPGSRRTPLSDTANHGTFASPTESEFSEAYDNSDSVKSWDEKQVGDWLRSIGCGAYVQTFRENNVNGSNLIECDQAVLKEMGIKKIGDRVRIFVGIKNLRSKALPNQKKRNRESMANLERYSKVLDVATAISPHSSTSRARDRSAGAEKRGLYPIGPSPGYPSPGRTSSREYFQPASANSVTGRRPETPSQPQSRNSIPVIAKLPADKEVIKVICGGQTKMLDIKGCKTAEDIMVIALKKMGRADANARNYCFYVTEPTAEDPDHCRRLNEKELLAVCSSPTNTLRMRLILRTIHSGEPTPEEMERSRAIAAEEVKLEHQMALQQNTAKGLSKVQRMLGEPLEHMQQPHSPAVQTPILPLPGDRKPTLPATALPASREQQQQQRAELDAPAYPPRRLDSKKKPLSKFMGNRPPSELISYDLTSYFPDHDSKKIERTVSMAQRRSARMSKALSRLSMASTFSVKDIMKDAPPMPSMPPNSFLSQDPFANSTGPGTDRANRPLSVWRQSVASNLHTLREENDKDIEPDRKSYVSFGDSASELGVTTPSAKSRQGSTTASLVDTDESLTAIEEGGSIGGTSTLNDQYRVALAEDGEGPDEELDAFLTGNTFDKLSWMQGALIGQGSFGSVYLALHAVTGELMAVKQVELPGKSGSDEKMDKRKESMLIALKREINLLSDMQHENIVQYLGVQATDEHLNIFLEYVPGGSVASMLNNYGHLQEPLIRNFVRQILNGLSYLHKRDIIHRDIKGANILVDNKGKVKISDFGISKKVDLQSASSGGPGGAGGPGNKRVSMQGSVFWMAPEVVRQTSYTRKADIWSMGCLVVEMFTGEHPFPRMNQMQAIFQIGGSKKPEIPSNASDEAKDFLERTFEIDENKRPEADELAMLPFLKSAAS